MIDLAPEHLDTIRAILAAHVPGIEVRAFGSRVDGTSRPYSDLDILLVGERAVTDGVVEALKDAFSVSNLPMMVDVLDWHAVSESFRAVLEQREYLLIQESP